MPNSMIMSPIAHRLWLCCTLSLLTLLANGQTFPPDLYGEALKDVIGFWENRGQVKNTNEQLVPEVLYYTQGALPRAYFQRKGVISFSLAKRDTSIAVPDTLYRLDMKCVGEHAEDVAPTTYIVKPY